MTNGVKIQKLDSTKEEGIFKIAKWYNEEWETPIEKTIKRLSNQPNDDVLFQLVLSQGEEIIATGGLCNEVNLLNVHPEFRKLGPWVALLYTDKEHRGNGFGKALLEQIESHASHCEINKIYLYTFTAESLYRRSGWKPIATVRYKNQDTLVMEKVINPKLH